MFYFYLMIFAYIFSCTIFLTIWIKLSSLLSFLSFQFCCFVIFCFCFQFNIFVFTLLFAQYFVFFCDIIMFVLIFMLLFFCSNFCYHYPLFICLENATHSVRATGRETQTCTCIRTLGTLA